MPKINWFLPLALIVSSVIMVSLVIAAIEWARR